MAENEVLMEGENIPENEILTEFARIASNVSNAYASLSRKGAILPEEGSQNTENLPRTIDTVEVITTEEFADFAQQVSDHESRIGTLEGLARVNVFVGSRAKYNEEDAKGNIPIGTLVILTDDLDDMEEISAVLGQAILG
jgi:hypothetical protein